MYFKNYTNCTLNNFQLKVDSINLENTDLMV